MAITSGRPNATLQSSSFVVTEIQWIAKLMQCDNTWKQTRKAALISSNDKLIVKTSMPDLSATGTSAFASKQQTGKNY
jgi:hypothetical protein